MKKQLLMMSTLVGVLSLSVGLALADDQARPDEKTIAKEPIYGSQLMTQYEKAVYRSKLYLAKTPKEREQIRLEHHKQMQERAKARGVTLPN